jgi:aminoglycoside phosphotransferase (APT) family kinase protein
VSKPVAWPTELIDWLHDTVGLVGPVRFVPLTGGNSNITVRVTDAEDTSVVLRRPPPVAQTGTYNLAREHAIVSGLASTPVPVPAAFAYCRDPAIWGAEFSVVEFVAGRRLANQEAILAGPAVDRGTIGQNLIHTLANINRTTAAQIGAEQLVREDYLGRQVARWSRQVRESGSLRQNRFDAVRSRLVDMLPRRPATTLLHGDFRIDNCLFGPEGEVRAVVDWELAAFGDPLADLALLYAYWDYPGVAADLGIGLASAPTALPGFPTKEEVLSGYSAHSGYSIDAIEPYLGFAYWKIACISEGVLWRYEHQEHAAARADVTEALESRINDDLSSASALLS